MNSRTRPTLDRFTIRRKVFKLFGGGFYILDPEGNTIGYSAQKAFKLREDITVFADVEQTTPLLRIQARSVIDFSAAYDIVDQADGTLVGTARRKGWTSLVRDSWELLDAGGNPVGKLEEDSTALALMRRLLSGLIPQRFHLDETGRDESAARIELDQRFNPFIYKLDVMVPANARVDRRLILGLAILLAAIEGRQD